MCKTLRVLTNTIMQWELTITIKKIKLIIVDKGHKGRRSRVEVNNEEIDFYSWEV